MMCQVKVTFLLKNSKKNKVKDSFGEADKIVASCKGVGVKNKSQMLL